MGAVASYTFHNRAACKHVKATFMSFHTDAQRKSKHAVILLLLLLLLLLLYVIRICKI